MGMLTTRRPSSRSSNAGSAGPGMGSLDQTGGPTRSRAAR
jgi:hypothetical protein